MGRFEDYHHDDTYAENDYFPEIDMNALKGTHSDHRKIESLANMENALADLLSAQADVLKEKSDVWSDKQLARYSKHMEKSLRNVILKEIILLLLLDEDFECKGKKKKHCCHCDHCKKKKTKCCHCRPVYY